MAPTLMNVKQLLEINRIDWKKRNDSQSLNFFSVNFQGFIVAPLYGRGKLNTLVHEKTNMNARSHTIY